MDATPGHTWESRGSLAACMRLLGGWGGVRPGLAESPRSLAQESHGLCASCVTVLLRHGTPASRRSLTQESHGCSAESHHSWNRLLGGRGGGWVVAVPRLLGTATPGNRMDAAPRTRRRVRLGAHGRGGRTDAPRSRVGQLGHVYSWPRTRELAKFGWPTWPCIFTARVLRRGLRTRESRGCSQEHGWPCIFIYIYMDTYLYTHRYYTRPSIYTRSQNAEVARMLPGSACMRLLGGWGWRAPPPAGGPRRRLLGRGQPAG